MPEETKPPLLDDKGSERNKLGTCAGFCECGTVPHRIGLCTGDNWQPIAATEETKPVERGAFDEWFDANYYTADPIAERTIRAAWNAALERAAKVLRAHPGYFRNRYVADDAISALEVWISWGRYARRKSE